MSGPEIDYLARDAQGFRRLMLDRLSLLVPGWRPRPADWPVAVVEALAHTADQLSYFQDAVATEAYLGTARRRTSVRRHARLLDYRLHEGVTARTWVELRVRRSFTLAAGAQLLSRQGDSQARIVRGSPAHVAALSGGAEVFETLHAAELLPRRNELLFATDARDVWLPEGATSTTLLDPGSAGQDGVGQDGAGLRAGDVLVFEEKRGPATGDEVDANPEHRHAVRLLRVRRASPSTLEIAWHGVDALPFALCLAVTARGRRHPDAAVARGNVVLAAHGRTVEEEPLEPEIVPEERRFRPRLRRRHLAHSETVDAAVLRARPAADALAQDPRAAVPELELREAESGEVWRPRRDLLASDRFARDVVVETDDDGTTRLRFGDGEYGRRPAPGTRFAARYRVGNGAAGNVGRDALAHLVVDEGEAEAVTRVRNPLAARGGVDLEPMERARLDAPDAFRIQERALTTDDWAAAARRHPEVTRAAAVRRRRGSWPVMEMAVERRGDRPVDTVFTAELRAFLERFRLMGTDFNLRGPRSAPVTIALRVTVAADRFPSRVRQALFDALGADELPDGRRGFFHRSRHGFGEALYLSRVVAVAMAVPGVTRVTATDFRRAGRPARSELETGRLELGPLEIVHLDHLELDLEGGR